MMKINRLYRSRGIGHLLWIWMWGPICLTLAFTPLLFLNLLQFPSLLLLPFSRNLFRKYNRVCAAAIWSWWAWGSQKIVGLEVIRSGDLIEPEENAMIVSNHQGMGDILVILCLALGKGRIGDLKWLVKDPLKWIPGLGWGMLFLECVFVKRIWEKDQSKLVNALRKFRRESIPVWLILFPEGTRKTAKNLASSRAYAESIDLRPYRYVLYPRTKGFQAVVAGLEDNIGAVYSLTIGYTGKAPSLIQLIRGDVSQVHCHIRRVPIQNMPSSDREREAWLVHDFSLKDKQLSYFYEHHRFRANGIR